MKVWARTADGTWHRAGDTYPNGAFAVCCGRYVTSWHFFAGGEPPSFSTVGEFRPNLCPKASR